jgi:uncharacterized protein (DUF1684 family)
MTGLLMMMALSAQAATPVETQVEAWRKQRIQHLTSENGWLTLAGLVWLKDGKLSAGTAPGQDLVLPAGMPPSLGTFTLDGGQVSFAPAPGVRVTRAGGESVTAPLVLVADAQGEPTLLRTGTFSFHVIKRGEKLGLRFRNTQADTRTHFHGIEMYPASATWVVQARWEAFVSPQKLKVPNVLGQLEDMDSPGVAVFTVGGKELRLQPVLEEGSDELFFIFGDETNKKETYGAGRFLYAPLPRDGHITLDFNHAYNPPCAFTPYATCPVPPAANRLATRVEAGEKRYANH